MKVKKNSSPGKMPDELPKLMIKFCGSCNPHIDTGKVANKLKELLAQKGVLPVYSCCSSDCQVLIILSGCPVDCAQRPIQTENTIVVAGSQVNLENCSPDLLPERVFQLLKNQCNL